MSYAFLDIGYIPPTVTGTFSVEDFNEASKAVAGYTPFSYWYLFGSDDAAELMDRDVCLP